MLTEEQVIQRIRTQLHAELDEIHPPVSVLADAWEHAHEQTAERRRRRHYWFPRLRIQIPHVGLGLAIAVPVLVAALAIILLGHGRSASPTRPGHAKPAIPLHTGASSSIDAALARGNRPPAPDSTTALPVLGSSATRSLRSFRGKVVVLNVFASWCQPCKAQTEALEQAQAVIAGQAATVLGVTYEDHPAASEAFVRAMHITYPVLRDATGRFGRSFGITGVPETFIIDRRGRIAAVLRRPVDDLWLSQTLGRLFPSQHLIPPGLPLEPLRAGRNRKGLPGAGPSPATDRHPGARRARSRRGEPRRPGCQQPASRGHRPRGIVVHRASAPGDLCRELGQRRSRMSTVPLHGENPSRHRRDDLRPQPPIYRA
jgi:cytochrome c biogenesis protein CcmG/thiol:disulfide interchange protein DsbE